MNEDREVNSDNSFLDNETIRSAEHEEIVDPRVFFALSNDLLVIAGSDGYFHRLNQTWEKTTGYTIEELRSRPFIEFVHPDDRERTLDTSNRNFAGGEIKGFENRYVCKDGSVRWFLWNSVPSKQANLTYAVAHDITDRKKVESELLDLSNALANAVEGIAQIDAHGEFMSTNKSFSQQLGYEIGELVGVHYRTPMPKCASQAKRILNARG
jgi:PAS domain S-box-containing protein